MSMVVTFDDYFPPPRFDAVPWTLVQIEEAPSEDGPWTVIDTLALSPDLNPAQPQERSFTTDEGTGLDLWYRITFLDDDGNTSLPTGPQQNTLPAADARQFATVEELVRILKIRAPSFEQRLALKRVLRAAAVEINAEIDLADDAALDDDQTAIAEEVTLERAVEHWRQEESPFGLIGLGAELGSAFTSKDSWERHALKLAPLKARWGLA